MASITIEYKKDFTYKHVLVENDTKEISKTFDSGDFIVDWANGIAYWFKELYTLSDSFLFYTFKNDSFIEAHPEYKKIHLCLDGKYRAYLSTTETGGTWLYTDKNTDVTWTEFKQQLKERQL